MSVEVPSHVRADLRASLAAAGHIPAAHLDEIVDLAIHAAQTGFATMQRIALNTSPDARVGITVLGPALGLLAGLVEAGMSALRKVAEAEGMTSVSFQIGGTRQ